MFALNRTIVFMSACTVVWLWAESTGRGLCCVVLYGRGVITYCTAMLFHSVLALIKLFNLRWMAQGGNKPWLTEGSHCERQLRKGFSQSGKQTQETPLCICFVSSRSFSSLSWQTGRNVSTGAQGTPLDFWAKADMVLLSQWGGCWVSQPSCSSLLRCIIAWLLSSLKPVFSSTANGLLNWSDC